MRYNFKCWVLPEENNYPHVVRNNNNNIGLAILYQLHYTLMHGRVLPRGFAKERLNVVARTFNRFLYIVAK